MRSTLAVILSLTVALVPVLKAQAQAAAAVTGQMVPSWSSEIVRKSIVSDLPRALKPSGTQAGAVDSLLKEAGVSRTVDYAGHVGQTLLFILTVAVLDLFIKRFGDSLTRKQPLSSQLVGLSDEVLNRATTYFSIIGGSVAGYGSHQAFQVLNKLLADPVSKSALVQTLAGAASLTVTFLAWDAGANLVREAAALLPDKESYERSQNLFGMTTGAFASLFFSTDENIRDGQVARQMLINVFRVALFDSELREKWFDGCWRHAMTGDFVALVTSMFAVGLAGSLIVPGAGTVAGLIFGFAGYALQRWVVPQAWKDGVTVNLQAKRQRILRADLSANEAELKSRSHVFYLFQKSTSQLIEQRRKFRSSYWTISVELVRLALKMMLKPNSSDTEVALAQQYLLRGFESGFTFCMEELGALERVRKAALEQERVALDQQIQTEVDRVKLIAALISDLQQSTMAMTDTRGGRLVYDALNPQEKDLVTFFETKYQRGFSEQQTVDLATKE